MTSAGEGRTRSLVRRAVPNWQPAPFSCCGVATGSDDSGLELNWASSESDRPRVRGPGRFAGASRPCSTPGPGAAAITNRGPHEGEPVRGPFLAVRSLDVKGRRAGGTCGESSTAAPPRIQCSRDGREPLPASVRKNDRIRGDRAGDNDRDAAAIAAAHVAAVRDDPVGRLALARSMYEEPAGGRAPRLRFQRAALAFMRWMAERGVLDPLHGTPPGSRWWRAMNERLLRDSCEALARAAGYGGAPATAAVDHWCAFIEQPTAQTWYRAHNASVVAAYLDHRDLADDENRIERFFLNVVLTRVLYAHALVAAPRLALGRIAACGPVLADPRRATVGIFLGMGRVLPDDYPAEGELEEDYLPLERRLGRALDYAVIIPRLRPLYDWSARELGRPELSDLVVDGTPAYAWPPDDRQAWTLARLSLGARALKALTAPREHAPRRS